MMHGFENKLVTENVMWTKQNTVSLIECAVRCGQQDLALSCGYNPSTLECVAYSARFTDPSAVAYVDNSEYRMYSLNPVMITIPAVPPLGFCTTSNDCLAANSTCMQGVCECNITHVFSYAAGGCVQGCSEYSTTFTTFAGHVIWGHDDGAMYVATEEECRAFCAIEKSIVCKTVQYNNELSTCHLSSFGWVDVAPSYRALRIKYNLHVRHCNF
ncbi:uncharacterized protein [Haliotis asinina]|uniref:uncharacterized protein n=1 Tax=Haliotis asinina TaxID=109174 RepID=UPI00353236A2